ncbi:hypothetical protein HN51_041208, partial [Arachis hypogaea]
MAIAHGGGQSSSGVKQQVKLEKESEFRIETPMVSYVNVQAILEAKRTCDKASSSGDSESSQGPRVIVVGPTDSGKTAKQGSKPTFVDLDIGQGSITIPGCIAATPIEMPIDPVEGITLEMPLVYFFGHTTPSQGTRADAREIISWKSRISCFGHGDKYHGLLLHAIRTLKANVVLEKLYSMLRDVLNGEPKVDVVKLQTSGGVVSRN